MADTPPATQAKSGSTFGFLGKKVFGKVPVWVIAVAAVGGYYWYTHYGPGKKTGAAMQTDPAGNTCTAINPATGYCPGTPEDAAALAAASTSGGTDTTGTTGGTDTTGGAAGTGNGAGGSTAGTPADTAPPPATGTAPPPATTGAPPPPVVVPAAPPPPDHAAAHRAHVAHEAHLAEERADKAQAARAHAHRPAHLGRKRTHR